MLNKIKQLFRNRGGSTMVELLVVISIIGILATAVLAALNPVEQLQKARDTARKADAQTLLGAIDRFQATFGCQPWMYDADPATAADGCQTNPLTAFATTMAINGSGNGEVVNAAAFAAGGALEQVQALGELKTQFQSRSTVTNTELWISVDTSNQPSVCFTPESRTARSGGLGPIRNWKNLNPPAPNAPTCDGLTYAAITNGSGCAVCVPQ